MTIIKTQPHIDLDEYIRQGEPSQKEKASIWQTAIGLQAVDGLHTSEYLRDTACKHIEGEIDIDEARELIRSYYQSKTLREPDDEEKQEADNVSASPTLSMFPNRMWPTATSRQWNRPTLKCHQQWLWPSPRPKKQMPTL